MALDARGSLPASAALEPGSALGDQRQRPLTDLRISVTDRCNFRCRYCMPREVFGSDFRFLPQPHLLSFEELGRVAGVFAELGVRKFRLTGGEPLLRRDLPKLVEILVDATARRGKEPIDVALTTNGALLGRFARELATAGLQRVTVSLDALDQGVFEAMNDTDVRVEQVLGGIDVARNAGLGIKVNCVVRRGINQDQILPLARHFRRSGICLRFIEFMDVGSTNGWRDDDVVTSREMLDSLQAQWPLVALQPERVSDVARRYAYADGAGEIGFISSVSAPFCGDCTRARLSADGQLFTCLFASRGVSLRDVLRGGASDQHLSRFIVRQWQARRDAYSEQRRDLREQPLSGALGRPVEMSFIGG